VFRPLRLTGDHLFIYLDGSGGGAMAESLVVQCGLDSSLGSAAPLAAAVNDFIGAPP